MDGRRWTIPAIVHRHLVSNHFPCITLEKLTLAKGTSNPVRTLLGTCILGILGGLVAGALLLLGLPHRPATLLAQGPGLSQQTYTEDELFSVISHIGGDEGAPLSHGTLSMHNGYLAVVYALGSGDHDGGFAFFDISDPYNPRLVSRKDDDDTFELREAHGYGYTRLNGRDVVALQAIRGVQFWDWTDIHAPVRLSYLELPGITKSDYSSANWWIFWQAPYLYVGGTGNGIYIVDAHDPHAPVLVDRGEQPNPIPISETGGFRIGPIFAVGNLLVAAGNDVQGYATLEISDPVNPVLLAAESDDAPSNYSAFVNGGRIYGAGRFRKLYVHDISDPTHIAPLGSVENTGDKGGYLSFQDGFVHMGASTNYVKVDVRDGSNPTLAGWATSGIEDADEDFATVLGNLVILSDDHHNGSFLIPHESEPDRRGPAVNMVVPADGAVQQRSTTRIGLTFTDLIDLRSVDTSTLIVRPVGGDPLPGRYSHQTNIVNFAPDEPLLPDTVYQVQVPAGGIRDVAGNPTETDFVSYFATGNTLSVPPTCRVHPPDPVPVGQGALLRGEVLTGDDDVRTSWDFGDGSAPSPWAEGVETTHVYAGAGHYTVQMTVRSNGLEGRCAGRLTVHHPLTAGAPAAASTILLDRRGDRVWNVNPDNNTVSVVDSHALQKLAEYPVGPHPTTLTQTGDHAIWVVNRDNATVSVLDPGEQQPVTATLSVDVVLPTDPFDVILPAASQPHGIVASPDGHAVYVTLQARNTLLRIDPDSRQIVDALDVGPTPRGLAVSADGSRVYVTRFISPDGVGEVVEVDTGAGNGAGMHVVRRIPLHYDPGPDTESSGRGLPNALHSIAISPDGRMAWVPSKKDNTARGGARDGQPLSFESTVRTVVSQIDVAAGVENREARHDFEDRGMAVAVAFSPLGDYGFVALQGSDAVGVLDAYAGTLATMLETTLEDGGSAPAGLVLSADGQRLFVHNFLSRSVSVYDIGSILRNEMGAVAELAHIPVVAHEQLAEEVLRGKRIFYSAANPRMSRDGYISCAACHLDSGDDGRTWDRTDAGEGLRNTTSLLGRSGTRHGLLHWSANFDEVQDFEHDVRELFGGTGFLNDADYAARPPLGPPKAGLDRDLDALAAYVASLRQVRTSPHRPATGTLTEAGAAGRELFQQLGCAGCHSGPQFTDSPSGVRHDVGTLHAASGSRRGAPLLGLDTPTLRGLWETPPYLHDGSAPTLRHVLLDANPAGLHGDTAALSAAEVEQLIAYLLQIDDLEPDAAGAMSAIRLVAPVQYSRVDAGATMMLQAVAGAGAQNPPARVEFYAGDLLLGADAAAPYELTWRPAAGTHRIAAMARYANGAATLSAEVTVFVGDVSVAPTPVASVPSPGPTITPEPQPASLLPGGYTDADADGVADLAEDVNANGNRLDDDSDGDGVPDFQDRDDDGDGLATRDELDLRRGASGAPVPRDTDTDGLPDYLDADDDNDGWPTQDESPDESPNEPPVEDDDDETPAHLDDAVHPPLLDKDLFLPLTHH